MGKIFKRALATIMVVLMVLTSAPLSGFVGFNWKAFATDDSQELILDTDDQITRAEWLHNLAVVFEMTVEDEIYPDNYFSDLEDTHEYYYDVLLNVNFGVIDVEAGGEVNPDGLVTRSFASHTLNFCLGYQLEDDTTYTFTDTTVCEYPADAQVAVNRGWLELVDGKFCPENSITDKEVRAMLDDTKVVLGDSEIDVDYDSEFTFSSEVIEVEDGTEIEVSDNSIIIHDSPVEITTDDIFAVYKSGIPLVYKAKTVSVQENATIITATYIDDTNGDYILEADAQGEADLEDVVITPAEGVDVDLNYEEEQVSLFALGKGDGNKKLANISAKGSIKLGSLGYSVSYSVELKKPTIQYAYNIGNRTAQVSFECDVETKTTLKVDLLEGYEKEVLIFNLGVPGVGGLDVYLKFDLSGSVSAVTKSSCKVGASYSPKDNFRSIKNFSSSTFSFQAKISGSAGVIVKLGVTQLPLVKAYVYAEAGGKASVDLKAYSSGTPKNCVEFAAYVYANYGATFKLKAGVFSFEAKAEEKVWDSKTSPAKIVKHYEDNKPVTKCTRGGSNLSNNYYTKHDSVYWGGWSEGDNTYGFNAVGEPIQIFEYSLDSDENATITSYKGNTTVVDIPETIDGYKVVGIGDKAFAFQHMNSVSIPDSVVQINAGAFLGCKNLKDVNLSKCVKKMGAYAFGDCDSLEEIEIPKSLEETYDAYYYDYYYGYCYGVFRNSDNFRRVTFEEGTTRIAKGLFASCENIVSIDIPDTVTVIGHRAFVDCSNLKEVFLPDSLTTIESDAFRNTAVERISIPDTVTRIDSGAFVDCNNLSDVELSKSLETMGAYAFGYCENLQSITIPKSLDKTTDAYYYEYIYGYQHGVFIGSDNLKKVEFEEGTTQIPEGLFANNQGIEEIDIPDTVTNIEYVAFANCKNLKSVKLSNSLVKIHSKAFRNTSITEIDIPDSVTEIADGAFADCKLLETVKLSKTLSTMGAYAFACCESLTSIEIPKSLKTTTNAYYYEYIYNYHFGPFFGCNNLKTVTFEEGATLIPQGLFANNEGLETIQIPATVTKIDYQAFLRCKNLKEVVLSAGLEEIVSEAFMETSLQNINLPETLKYIRRAAFYGTKLETLDIPDSVTVMEKEVFRGCTLLNTVDLPNTQENIGEYMFEGCTSLKKIELPSTVTAIYNHAFKDCISLEEIVLNDKLTRIDSYAFENCDSLVRINIPDSVTVYGEGVFYDCDTLKNVTLGNGMSALPKKFFEQCDAIESVSLPYRTATVGDQAFKECINLTTITIPRATTSIASNAFSYPAKLTINGVAGTYAESYANEIGATFVDKQVKATAVTIDKKTATLNKGQSMKLVMTVTPSNFTDEVSWKSGNTDVATISADGTITAKSVGTATIKLTVGSVSASCKVTVVQPVTSVNIDKSSVTMQAHDTYQLKLTVYPDNAANKTVEWSSSASDIASVDQNGLVTAHKKGEATIRVDAKDGSNKYDTCKIIVSNNGVIANSVSELESAHNYPVNCTDFWRYTSEGAANLEVTFDERTNIEDGFDYLYIYDGAGNEVGKYTGTELSGKTITVSDDTVRIQLDSDDSGTEWGFKVTEVKIASAHIHSYSSKTTESPSCTKTGTKTFTCACGDTYTETIAKLGHSYSSSYTIDKKATCSAEGSKSKHCTRSGCTAKTDVTVIEKQPHTFTEKIIDSAHLVSTATTESPAVYKYDCANCDVISDELTFAHGEKLNAFGKPEKITTAQNTSAIKLTWTPVEGAAGYKVYQMIGGQWKALGNTIETTATIGNLEAGTKYTFAVMAGAIVDGKVIWADNYTVIETATQTIAPKKIAAAQNANAIRLAWTPCPGATGYRIFYKSGNSWKICLNATTATSHTFTNLKAGTKFTFAVRPYIITDSGVIWSDYTTYTASTLPAIPKTAVTSPSSGKITVKWNAVSGAEAYQLYYKTGNGGYKLYKNYFSVQTVSFSGLKSGTKYTFAVRAAKNTSGGWVFGSFTPVSVTVK